MSRSRRLSEVRWENTCLKCQFIWTPRRQQLNGKPEKWNGKCLTCGEDLVTIIVTPEMVSERVEADMETIINRELITFALIELAIKGEIEVREVHVRRKNTDGKRRMTTEVVFSSGKQTGHLQMSDEVGALLRSFDKYIRKNPTASRFEVYYEGYRRAHPDLPKQLPLPACHVKGCECGGLVHPALPPEPKLLKEGDASCPSAPAVESAPPTPRTPAPDSSDEAGPTPASASRKKRRSKYDPKPVQLHIGDRVKMTGAGMAKIARTKLAHIARTGKVESVGESLLVIVDGQSFPNRWHPSYWEKE